MRLVHFGFVVLAILLLVSVPDHQVFADDEPAGEQPPVERPAEKMTEAEREAALAMIDKHRPSDDDGKQRRITLGGDKGFDVADFVEQLRDRQVTPHIAVHEHLTKTGKRRKTKIDGRTTRHPGYQISQRIRKRIEEIFGWIKQGAGLRQSKFRGRTRVNAQFTLALAAYNLIRLPQLLEAPP